MAKNSMEKTPQLDSVPRSQQEISLAELVAESKWDSVQQLLTDGLSFKSLRGVVDDLIGNYDLERVWEIARRFCSVEERGEIIQMILQHEEWEFVSPVAALGVSREIRDMAFLKAVESSVQWYWCFVEDLLKLGVSCGVRDKAFLVLAGMYMWDRAEEVMKLGVSPQSRSSALLNAIHTSDARFVADLIKLGVSQSSLHHAFTIRIKGGPVTFLMEVVKLCDDAKLTDFVLGAAVTHKQWELVVELMKEHEVLHLPCAQKTTTCNAAVRAQQWECVLFLLENGVIPTQGLLKNVLRFGGDTIERLLTPVPGKSICPVLKERLMQAAIEVRSCAVLQVIVKRFGVNGKELYAAFDSAVKSRNPDVLYALISCSNETRNFFRRFCLADGGIMDSNIRWVLQLLKDRGNVRMALDIAVSLSRFSVPWNFVSSVLTDDKASRKMRMMFMNKICSKSAQEFLLIANKLCRLDHLYRRPLFLMAARHGKLSEACSLFGKGVRMSDVRFAFRVCLHSHTEDSLSRELKGFYRKLNTAEADGLYKNIVRELFGEFAFGRKPEAEAKFLHLFHEYCEQRGAEANFVVSMFQKGCRVAVKFNRLKCFAGCCEALTGFCDTEISKRDEEYDISADDDDDFPESYEKSQNLINAQKSFCSAIDLAIRKKRYRFIHKKCHLWDLEYIEHAIKEAFEKRAWPLLAKLTHKETKRGASPKTTKLKSNRGGLLLDFLEKSIGDAEVLNGGAVVLDGWLRNCCPKLLYKKLSDRLSFGQKTDKTLALWCCQNSCSTLALFLSIAQGDDDMLHRVVSRHHGQLDMNFLFDSCRYLMSKKNYSSAVILLKYLPVSILKSSRLRDLVPAMILSEQAGEVTFGTVPSDLMLKLKSFEIHNWLTVFHVQNQHFSQAEKTLELCQDQYLVDYVVDHAAAIKAWNTFCKHVSKSTDPRLLYTVLLEAVWYYQVNVVKTVIGLDVLDLTGSLAFAGGQRTYLYEATCSSELETSDQQQAFQICQYLIQAGVSTFERSFNLDPKLDKEQCPLMLACVGGNLDFVRLFHRSGVCSNRRLFLLIEKYRTRPLCQADILDYLNKVACSPLSLQDLSRQAVSHCVGCRPGRRERIQALPVPQTVKDFLSFPDLISVPTV